MEALLRSMCSRELENKAYKYSGPATSPHFRCLWHGENHPSSSNKEQMTETCTSRHIEGSEMSGMTSWVLEAAHS